MFIIFVSFITLIKSVCEGDWQFKDVPIEQSELDAKLKPELFCPTEIYLYNCYYLGATERAHNITKNRKWVSTTDKCQQFDAKGFLNLIRNRNVYYVGDSTMVETWQSIVCQLYQAAKYVLNVGWYFHQVLHSIVYYTPYYMVHFNYECDIKVYVITKFKSPIC